MSKPARILKKDKEVFENNVNAFFDSLCHIKPRRIASDAFADYRYIKTRFGVDYEIREVEASDGLYNVMGAFEGGKEEYARIREAGIDCNPFTGKWNFHLMDCTPQGAVGHIITWFERILPYDDPSLTIDNRGDHLMLSVDSAVERYMLMQAVEDGRDVSLYDALIEPFACNGGYTVIDPNAYSVGLTSDPYILAEHATIEDDGGVTVEGGLYHYPDYMVKNLVKELALGNPVKLIRFHHAAQPEKIERTKP